MFIGGFIHQYKETTAHTDLRQHQHLSVLFISGRSFIVQDVLKAFSQAWSQSQHFSEAIFFQYANTITQSNVTFYCNFRLRSRSPRKILRLSNTIFKDSYHGCSEQIMMLKICNGLRENSVNFSKESHTFQGRIRLPIFITCTAGHHPFKFQKKPASQISHANSSKKQESNEQRKCKIKGKHLPAEGLRGSSYLKWRSALRTKKT